MAIDLINRLQEYINGLDLSENCIIGTLEDTNNFVLYPIPGGETVIEYYNGIKDRQIQFACAVKNKNNSSSYAFLNELGNQLDCLEDLPSSNGSYLFQDIKVTSRPEPVVAGENNTIYSITVQVIVTVH